MAWFSAANMGRKDSMTSNKNTLEANLSFLSTLKGDALLLWQWCSILRSLYLYLFSTSRHQNNRNANAVSQFIGNTAQNQIDEAGAATTPDKQHVGMACFYILTDFKYRIAP